MICSQNINIHSYRNLYYLTPDNPRVNMEECLNFSNDSEIKAIRLIKKLTAAMQQHILLERWGGSCCHYAILSPPLSDALLAGFEFGFWTWICTLVFHEAMNGVALIFIPKKKKAAVPVEGFLPLNLHVKLKWSPNLILSDLNREYDTVIYTESTSKEQSRNRSSLLKDCHYLS